MSSIREFENRIERDISNDKSRDMSKLTMIVGAGGIRKRYNFEMIGTGIRWTLERDRRAEFLKVS